MTIDEILSVFGLGLFVISFSIHIYVAEKALDNSL